jgi:hypothetical protein
MAVPLLVNISNLNLAEVMGLGFSLVNAFC